MKQYLLTAVLAVLSATPALASPVSVSTPGNTIVVSAEKGETAKLLYYGPRLTAKDIENLEYSGIQGRNLYPGFGHGETDYYAIAVKHADGNMSLDLRVLSAKVENCPEGQLLEIRTSDTVYPFNVTICFKAYSDVDMIETWTEIENAGKKPVDLLKFYSCMLPVRQGDVWVSHLYGGWANEARLVEEPLKPGILTLQNKDGVRNSQTAHAEVMLSLDGKPREESGDVIGAALCYTGNYQIDLPTLVLPMGMSNSLSEYHFYAAGICPENSTYPLQPREVFTTPEVALTFSRQGLGGASRAFHRWARSYKLAHGDQPRSILLNSWEGVYFDIEETNMNRMMADLASIGGELFVMDDGWFGDKYQRDNSSALGDWTVDRRKLPHGIDGLCQMARDNGVRFGIWIEPEMCNTVSELYEKHPDWIINARGRDVITGRGGTQVILDMGRKEVQDYVFGVVDGLLGNHPGISYVKWDANMTVASFGSSVLKADEQSKLFINYHRGLDAVCKRIRAKYPDVTIQACASGGGRVNYGYLPYFDEFWTSDDTDALQRIYIQWGTSYFFPAIAMGSHISAVPNHILGRVTPLKFRADVAMSGRLGLELQPKDLSAIELAQCKRAIADYKTIRNTVQLGDLYRLHSPYSDLGVSSLMYVSEDKSDAVVMWYRTEHFYDHYVPWVRMAGLDPDKTYRVVELNRMLVPDGNAFKDGEALPFEGRSFTGKFLMETGLEIPFCSLDMAELKFSSAYSSRVLHLMAE